MAQRQFKSTDTDVWAEAFGNGSDGALTVSGNITESPTDSSCSGTSGTNSLSATNASFSAGQAILIHQTRGTGAGVWELNVISSYSTGTITTKYALTNTYTDSGSSQAQVRVLPQYTSVTIDSGITYTGKSWNGNVGGILAFICNGATTITGNIFIKGANGTGPSTFEFGAVAGGFAGGNTASTETPSDGFSGEGTAGASVAQNQANGSGGGGGDNAASGGGGGNATAGAGGTGFGTSGTGGEESGNAALTIITPGGGGGGGNGANSWQKGSGASGGGIVIIISKTLTVTGSINTTGGAGGSGGFSGDGRAAGGGGAGGSILMKAQTATLGSSLVLSSGGAGGTSDQRSGGAGSAGRIHLDYKLSFTGTTSPTLDSTQDPTLDYPVREENYTLLL